MTNKSFMGHGSPQALEAALDAKDEHFEVAREDLLFSIACSDLPQEEVVQRMANRPSGTSAGWVLAEHPLQGSPCREKPGFKHYIFEC